MHLTHTEANQAHTCLQQWKRPKPHMLFLYWDVLNAKYLYILTWQEKLSVSSTEQKQYTHSHTNKSKIRKSASSAENRKMEGWQWMRGKTSVQASKCAHCHAFALPFCYYSFFLVSLPLLLAQTIYLLVKPMPELWERRQRDKVLLETTNKSAGKQQTSTCCCCFRQQ